MIRNFFLFYLLFIFSLFCISESQISILPARTTEIPDLSVSEDTYGTPLNYPFDSTIYDDCAEINNIQRTDDGLYYKIKIDLKLNGRGCKKVIPWTTAPSSAGMKIYGTKALETCFTNDKKNNCVFVNSGPANGISISFDPPSYSFPLSVPQNAQTVSFGNAGYFSYELESKGACANYGYKNVNSEINTKINSASHITIALSFPLQGTCDRLPTQSSFMSSSPASVVAQNVLQNLNYPITINSTIQGYLNSLSLSNTSNIIPAGFGIESMPYGYINATNILNIIDPFLCKPNSSSHTAGALKEEIHACPMTVLEWNSILPDVVLFNETVDILYGPNTTSYGSFQRDGPWIPPNQYSNALPLQFHRCNPRDRKGVQPANNGNYASKHMPINLNFGPTCTSLQADNSHITAKVNVGGFVGISNTVDPFSGNWKMSMGFPVRPMNQIGNTLKISNISAPGSTLLIGVMFGKISTNGGTNGNALKIDANGLRYILCNGLSGSVTPGGFNSNISASIGPLISSPRNETDPSPIWTNPFRYTSDVFNNSNCFGCTFPTIRSQKGWTIMDAQIWGAGQGIECGKYQSDHALWARVLALVAKEIITINNVSSLPFFSFWNQTSGQTDFFQNNALKLNLNNVSIDLPQIIGNFIPGIGKDTWVRWLGDLGKYSCRPASYPYSYKVSNGQQPIPMCMLLQRQLYYQTYMLNATLSGFLRKAITTPDLDSAAQTGIYNPLAPNIWFGVYQKTTNNGNAEWLMFLEDTFDRTGNSIFEEDGIAENVTASVELLVPVSSVAGPSVVSPLYTTFSYSVSNSFCQVFDVFAKPNFSPISFIGSLITFNSPYNNVPWIFVRFSTIFQGEANFVKFNYQTSQITVYVISGSNPIPVLITNWFFTIDGNDIILKLPYDTVHLQNQYQINIPVLIGSLATNILPIIGITSYFETTIFPSNIFYVNLSNSNSPNYIGCSSMASESTNLISPNRYSCQDSTYFSSFQYVISPSSQLASDCSNPNQCRSFSNEFDINSCGFGLNPLKQKMEHNIHFSFDGSSVNYNLLSEVLSSRFSLEYDILNCGKNTTFLSDSFFVQFCGSIGNTITGMKKTIPCNNYVLSFYYNGIPNQLIAFVDWGSQYITLFEIYFTSETMHFDITFDPLWFIPNENKEICINTSNTDFFCHFKPENLIVNLNMMISVPFKCGQFLQKAALFDDIQISSNLKTFFTLVDGINIYKTDFSNYDPFVLTCAQSDSLTDGFFSFPITTTSTSATQTWTNTLTLPTFQDIITFVEEFDEKIQGILPPCAIDFSNVVINPDLIPMNSACTPYVASGTYQIYDNCSLFIYGNQIQTVRSSSIPYYQNIYYVPANFSTYFTYLCRIMPILGTEYNTSLCTVNGTTGARNGTNCYLYEDLLQNCEQWWNFSCGIITFPQALFFFSFMFITLLILIFFSALIFLADDEREEKDYKNWFNMYFDFWSKKWQEEHPKGIPSISTLH